MAWNTQAITWRAWRKSGALMVSSLLRNPWYRKRKQTLQKYQLGLDYDPQASQNQILCWLLLIVGEIFLHRSMMWKGNPSRGEDLPLFESLRVSAGLLLRWCSLVKTVGSQQCFRNFSGDSFISYSVWASSTVFWCFSWTSVFRAQSETHNPGLSLTRGTNKRLKGRICNQLAGYVASLCIISTHFFTSSAWNNALLY